MEKIHLIFSKRVFDIHENFLLKQHRRVEFYWKTRNTCIFFTTLKQNWKTSWFGLAVRPRGSCAVGFLCNTSSIQR